MPRFHRHAHVRGHTNPSLRRYHMDEYDLEVDDDDYIQVLYDQSDLDDTEDSEEAFRLDQGGAGESVRLSNPELQQEYAGGYLPPHSGGDRAQVTYSAGAVDMYADVRRRYGRGNPSGGSFLVLQNADDDSGLEDDNFDSEEYEEVEYPPAQIRGSGSDECCYQGRLSYDEDSEDVEDDLEDEGDDSADDLVDELIQNSKYDYIGNKLKLSETVESIISEKDDWYEHPYSEDFLMEFECVLQPKDTVKQYLLNMMNVNTRDEGGRCLGILPSPQVDTQISDAMEDILTSEHSRRGLKKLAKILKKQPYLDINDYLMDLDVCGLAYIIWGLNFYMSRTRDEDESMAIPDTKSEEDKEHWRLTIPVSKILYEVVKDFFHKMYYWLVDILGGRAPPPNNATLPKKYIQN